MLNAEELSKYYPDEYLPHRPLKNRDYLWHHRQLKRFVLRWYYGYSLGGNVPPKILRTLSFPISWALSKSTMKSMIRWHGKGHILDVGCGNGGWLLRMKAAGWSVQGVEPDGTAAMFANKADIPVHCGTLPDAGFHDRSFDLIRFHYVFEHIHNPNEILEEVRRIMASDGICLIRVPNIKSVNFSLFKKYWFPLDIPRHVVHYTPDGMQRIAQKHGMKVKRIMFRSPKTGFFTSIEYMKKNGVAPWYFRVINCRSKLWHLLWRPFGKLIDLCHRGDIVEYTLVHDVSLQTQK